MSEFLNDDFQLCLEAWTADRPVVDENFGCSPETFESSADDNILRPDNL